MQNSVNKKVILTEVRRLIELAVADAEDNEQAAHLVS